MKTVPAASCSPRPCRRPARRTGLVVALCARASCRLHDGAQRRGPAVGALSLRSRDDPDRRSCKRREEALLDRADVLVLASLDVTAEERVAALNGLRLTALGLAFSAYALLLDHDRLFAAFVRLPVVARRRASDGSCRRSSATPPATRRRYAAAACPRGRPGPRAAVPPAARRRVARAGVEPGGGDGGAGLRPRRRRDAGGAADVVAARPRRRRPRRADRRRGSALL